MTNAQKLLVPEQTVINRINARLKRRGHELRKADEANHDVGSYYIVDTNDNLLWDTHLTLNDVAFSLCVLEPSEEIDSLGN